MVFLRELEGSIMKKLVSTTGMSRADWLAWRRRGIGGSDAAALVGLSPWATPFSVYADKLGLLPEQEDNEAMRQGRELEEYVARRFSEASGKNVRRCNAVIQHPRHDFMLANVDRLICGERAGLECKTMNPRSPSAPALERGDVPVQYYVQCQHYMAVTGLSKWYLAILVLGTAFYWFDVPRHDGDIAALEAAEAAFWKDCVLARCAPEPDDTPCCEMVLKQLYPRASEDKEITLETDRDALDRLSQIKRAQAALEQERRGLENKLRAQMQDAAIGHAGGYTVSLLNRMRSGLDVQALRAEHPEILEHYSKTITYRSLTVKENE